VVLNGDDLAIKSRSVEDSGPLAMITHPRDGLLALTPKHIVCGPDRVRARVWSDVPVKGVEARIDGGEWFKLEQHGDEWEGPLAAERLAKGEHALEVRITGSDAVADRIDFFSDRTGRFTAAPKSRPDVSRTAFC